VALKFPGGTSTPLPPKSKNATENKTNIRWKYGIDVLGIGKKVKCN